MARLLLLIFVHLLYSTYLASRGGAAEQQALPLPAAL
jgi:hypothetical protein